MLTVDFDRAGVTPGAAVLDAGCGTGRHTFEALRRGASVASVDLDPAALHDAAAMVAAMRAAGEVPEEAAHLCVRADVRALPFAPESFDVVIASEVLEHVHEDWAGLAELVRVTRPRGRVVVTVPRFWPERVCWWLSETYRRAPGGHVRIYRAPELRSAMRAAGLEIVDSHHAHALHSPYWWLRCATGLDGSHPAARAYHRLLVWDIERRPLLTRVLERGLDPVLGKSLVLYGVRRDPLGRGA